MVEKLAERTRLSLSLAIERIHSIGCECLAGNGLIKPRHG
jgi:hypothetical protein